MGEYKVQVAKDGHLLSFLCTICARLFDEKITKNNESSLLQEQCLHHCLDWHGPGNAREEGAPPKWSLVRLKWKCTGAPTTVKKHDYLKEYTVKDRRGELHMQCYCIVLITVKKAEEQAKAEFEVESNYIDLFGIDRSQSHPSPPP